MGWVLYDNKNAFDNCVSCDNDLKVIQEDVQFLKR